MGKRSLPRKTNVLSASEIGQFMYCSYAWYLHRCGYEPDSPFLEPGKQAHVDLGNKIDTLETRMQYSRWIILIGIVALLLAFLFFFFGVIS
jgi:CRISPR/Cas system-associated exonuclease Cas4 (RecB family)